MCVPLHPEVDQVGAAGASNLPYDDASPVALDMSQSLQGECSVRQTQEYLSRLARSVFSTANG